jgi:hypothetical protein
MTWGIRKFYLMSLGVRLIVGAILVASFILLLFNAYIFRETAVIKNLILFGGSAVIIYLYMRYGWSIVNKYRSITFGIGTMVFSKGEKDDHVPTREDGEKMFASHFESAQHIGDFVGHVRRSVRNIHRHLIDITSQIRWMKKLRISRIMTELTHGTARFIESAITARALVTEPPRPYVSAKNDILNYVNQWKEIGGLALRLFISQNIVTILMFFFLFFLCYSPLISMKDSEIQLVILIFLILAARFLIHGLIEPVYNFMMLTAFHEKPPSEAANAEWHERILQVSRSYRLIELQAKSEVVKDQQEQKTPN